MPDPAYVAAALAAAVAITVALRGLPFLAKAKLQGSALLDDLGRWMPLGAVAILAGYSISHIDPTPRAAAGPAAGIAVTIAVHAWRHNAVLSILAGTATCVLTTTLIA